MGARSVTSGPREKAVGTRKPRLPAGRSVFLIALALLLVLLAPSGNASAATEKTTFFSLSSAAARAVAMTAGPDGNVWFARVIYYYSYEDEIGRVTPSGQVTEFPLPSKEPGKSGLPAIVTGPDGNLWFTESIANQIGRITTSGQITQFPLPHGESRPVGITAGPDGNLWFTEQAADKIGRYHPRAARSPNSRCQAPTASRT